MKIHLATGSSNPWSHEAIAAWTKLHSKDRFGEHTLTSSPEEADIILFVDLHLEQWPDLREIRNHEFWKRYPAKTLAYDERDRPVAALPGLAVSMPKSQFDWQWNRPCAYYTSFHQFDKALEAEPDLLFSFKGGNTHKLREQIFALSHPRAIIEKAEVNHFDLSGGEELKRQQQQQLERFRELLGRSKFVLCPRGHGASSIRMYEVMAAGRVPVVISDEWTPVQGVDWESCSVIVPENEISSIPQRLEALEERYPSMAHQARAVYDEQFGPQVHFQRMVEKCQDLLAKRPHPNPIRVYTRDFYTARSVSALRSVKHGLKKAIRR